MAAALRSKDQDPCEHSIYGISKQNYMKYGATCCPVVVHVDERSRYIDARQVSLTSYQDCQEDGIS